MRGDPPDTFIILESGSGSLSGFIPADVATCDDCITDIFTPGGRYEGYWATSCVNASVPIHRLSTSQRPVFLINSRLGLFTAAPRACTAKVLTLPGHPFSQSYGVNLPSSLTRVFPRA